MSRPIEPTPTLDAEDSETLRASLNRPCDAAEALRRQEWAARYIEQATSRPHPTDSDPNRAVLESLANAPIVEPYPDELAAVESDETPADYIPPSPEAIEALRRGIQSAQDEPLVDLGRFDDEPAKS